VRRTVCASASYSPTDRRADQRERVVPGQATLGVAPEHHGSIRQRTCLTRGPPTGPSTACTQLFHGVVIDHAPRWMARLLEQPAQSRHHLGAIAGDNLPALVLATSSGLACNDGRSLAEYAGASRGRTCRRPRVRHVLCEWIPWCSGATPRVAWPGRPAPVDRRDGPSGIDALAQTVRRTERTAADASQRQGVDV